MANISRLIIGLGVDPGELQRGLQQGIAHIRTFATSLGTATARGFRTATDAFKGFLANFRQGLNDLGSNKLTQLLGVGAITLALQRLAGAAARMSIDVDASLRRLAATVPTVIGNFGRLNSEIQRLSIETGQPLQNIARGFEGAARGGVQNMTELTTVMRAAARASQATGVELVTVVNGLDQALDLFGKSGGEAEAVLARLFVTAQGKSSLDEMLESLDKLAPVVQKTGVDFETLTAAMATLINTGFNARNAVARLNDTPLDGIRELARRSLSASDGMKELRAQADLVSQGAGHQASVIRAELNVELQRLADQVIPSLIRRFNDLVSTLSGSGAELSSNAAAGTIDTIAVALDRLTSAGRVTALENLRVALQDIAKTERATPLNLFGTTIDIEGISTRLDRLSDTNLRRAQRGLQLERELTHDLDERRRLLETIQDIGEEMERRGIRSAPLVARPIVVTGPAVMPGPLPKTLTEIAALQAAQAKLFAEEKAQVGAVIVVLNEAVAKQLAFTTPLQAAVGLYTDLNARIEASGGKITETTAALVQMRTALAEAINAANVSVLNRELEPLERRLTVLQSRAAGGGPGLGADPRVTMADLVTLHEELNTKARALGPITIDNAGAFIPLVVLMEQASAAMDNISKAGGKLLDEDGKAGIFDPRTMSSSLDAILNIGTALAGIATSGAFGELDDDMQNAITSTLALLGALEQVREAMALGGGGLGSLAGITGLIGGVGAAVGLLSSLGSLLLGGGPSPTDELLKENNDRMKELVSALNLNVKATSDLLKVQNAIPRLDVGRINDINVLGTGSEATSQLRLQELNRQLQQFGLTFADLQRVAKDNGISLLDANGRLAVDALNQLEDILGVVITDLTRFGTSLEEQRTLQDARNRILGRADTPGQDITDIRALFSSQATALFQQLFAGIDTASTTGQAALRARVITLFQQLEQGLIPPGSFGTLDKDQLLALLLGLDDALDALKKNLVAFNDTLEEQRARLQLRDALAGKTTAVDTINRELELLGQFAPAIADMFVGIDTTTTEGRTLLRTALQNLFNLMDAGLISDAMLGQLTGADQLADIIGIIVGALGGLGDAVNDVTRAMLNIPTGFRIDAARFQAQDFAGFDTGERPTFFPRPPSQPTQVVNHWDVIVTANGVNDPEKLATQTLVALERKALAQGVSHWTKVVPT